MPIGRMKVSRPERERHTTSWVRHGLVSAIIGLTLGTLGAETARAGEYVMRNCNVPGYGNGVIDPWVKAVSYQTVELIDGCATGGGVSFSMNTGSTPHELATVTLTEPADSRGQISLVKAVLWYAARLQGSGRALRVMAYPRAGPTYQFLVLARSPLQSEHLTAELPLNPDITSIGFGIYCGPLEGDPATTEPCVSSSAVPLLIRGIEVTLREDVPPMVLPPVGTLLEDGLQSGVRTLSYSAADAQSGLTKVEVMLGDTVVASSDLRPRCPYSDFTVCPASQDETLHIDTHTVVNGSHPLTLRAQDAAGNERVVEVADAIQVSNASVAGTPFALAYQLTAEFKGAQRSTLTVPYGRPVSLQGHMTQGSQPSAVGTPIDVLERLDRPGARERVVRTILTKADGSFKMSLATSRPSRVVRVAYRPLGGGEVYSDALRLRVRAALRLRASLRGRAIHFSGEVVSGPVPRRGKRVQMEGRSPGSAWTPFRILRTDRNGRFSGTYQLRVRRPGVLLQVRAVVPKEDGYGYLSSGSRPVALRVR